MVIPYPDVQQLCYKFRLRDNETNEWYPRWIQISLHIRSPGLQAFLGGWVGGGGLGCQNWKYSKCQEMAKLQLGGGVFWDTWIWTLTIFILGGGGYSGTLGFGLSDNFHFGGYSGTLGFGLSDNFHLGGYSGTLRFGLSDNFHFGGVFWDTRIWTLWQCSLRGVFWDTWIWTLWQFSFWGGILGHSDLDSLTIFIWGGILGHSDLDSLTIFMWGGGGYSGTLRFGLSDNFHFGGGYSVPSYYRIGVFRVWTKISTTPAGSCITDSLSHTTYVETNYYMCNNINKHCNFATLLNKLVYELSHEKVQVITFQKKTFA